jgi:Tfp pilus assembly protein FimT
VVIFIIALFAAVVYPTLSINMGQTKKDIHRMASVLRYVRDSALYQKRSLKVVFNLKEKTVRYETPEGEKSIELEELVGVKTPTHGLVKEGQLIVVFNLLGQAEPMVIYFQEGQCVEYNPYSQLVRETECEPSNQRSGVSNVGNKE